MLGSVLEKCLSIADADFIKPFDLSDECKQKCNEEPVQAMSCACVQMFLADNVVAKGSGTVRTFLRKALAALYDARTCGAIVAQLRAVVVEICRATDTTAHMWAELNWHRSEAAQCAGNKKKAPRVDPHVKRFCLQGSAEKGLTTTIGQAAKTIPGVDSAMAVKWREAAMAAYRTSCLMTFSQSQTLSIAFDGARLGRPAKEFLVTFLSDTRRNLHCAIPPVVFTA
jgi:hypothetical protein